MASGHTRETLVAALKAFAAESTGRISLQKFCDAVPTSPPVIKRCFPKGYREFIEAAGLGDRYSRVHLVSREVLMEEFDRLAGVVGRVPTREELERFGRIRPSTFRRKLGSWRNVVRVYERWKVGKEVRELKHAGGRAAGGAGIEDTGGQAARGTEAGSTEGPGLSPLEMTKGERAELVRGEPLGFRGLLHAPTTELGVIHLFGLLSPDLSIAVEHIGAAYPDCRALRPEPGTSGKWRRIAIEFELRSSNFKHHGHDPKLCDLVVCWEHDWPACPVEVLELKSVMKRVGK